VAEAEEKQAATDGVRSVVEGEELVVWTEEEGEEEADEGVAERWMEHMPEDRVAAAATARARAASRRPVTRGGTNTLSVYVLCLPHAHCCAQGASQRVFSFSSS
jgi:hypothetical protein